MRAVAIVPTYNEADNIEILCRSIRKHAPSVGTDPAGGPAHSAPQARARS